MSFSVNPYSRITWSKFMHYLGMYRPSSRFGGSNLSPEFRQMLHRYRSGVYRREGMYYGDRRDLTFGDALGVVASETASSWALASTVGPLSHAGQSPMPGKKGMALRVTGRVGVRFVPILGAAAFIYDVYSLGKFLSEYE